jgi:hypothetical protein
MFYFLILIFTQLTRTHTHPIHTHTHTLTRTHTHPIHTRRYTRDNIDEDNDDPDVRNSQKEQDKNVVKGENVCVCVCAGMRMCGYCSICVCVKVYNDSCVYSPFSLSTLSHTHIHMHTHMHTHTQATPSSLTGRTKTAAAILLRSPSALPNTACPPSHPHPNAYTPHQQTKAIRECESKGVGLD